MTTDSDTISHDAGRANLLHLAAAWFFFLLSFPTFARIPYALALIPFTSLVFQQYLAGVIHEAAHWQFYRKDRRINDMAGNWGASFVFGYSLEAYRKEHFRHHASDVFLNDADGETAEYAIQSRSHMVRGFLRDLFFITAAKMVYFRLSPMFTRPASAAADNAAKTPFRAILLFSACLWGGMAIVSSILAVTLFWLSFLTLYPLSNRIRVYATHGDITRAQSMKDTEVAVNVLSPVYERIFFGNRMMMYHHEHHSRPNLPFRKLEELAWERHRSADEVKNHAVSVPSYFFSLLAVLKGNQRP